METIISDGIELVEFTPTEEELVVRTISDGSHEACLDLFDAIEGIELYFGELPNSTGYKPLPRLLMSLNMEFES